MKCNYKQQMKDQLAKDVAKTSGTVKRLWELETLLTLHREFGFGVTRLKRFASALSDIYSEFTMRASASDVYDKKHREMTNIDVAIINILQELRAAGIDHRDILGDSEKLIITDEKGKEKDLDGFLSEIERQGSVD